VAVDNVKLALNILTQCRDSLEWQVGTGKPEVDFLFPKIKQAVSLLEVGEDEDEDGYYRERTTGDELREHLSTYDFVIATDSNDEE
jgi:hypothetical protein